MARVKFFNPSTGAIEKEIDLGKMLSKLSGKKPHKTVLCHRDSNYVGDFTHEVKEKLLPLLPLEIKLEVNGKEYPNDIGAKTDYGFYKNGYKAIRVKNYVMITGFTSCNKRVCLDHSFTFKLKKGKWILKRVSGIHNSWISTPKTRTFANSKDGLMVLAMSKAMGGQPFWRESVKFCREFFEETHIFR